MNRTRHRKHRRHAATATARLLLIAVALGGRVVLSAQAPAGAPAPKSAREAAPIDLTGYWVSVVTEDWRWRMVTPLKGDAASMPINAAARKIVDAWDPDRDTAAGEQCKAYGAPGIMRLPGRFHFTWQDDNTLKVETDYGQQTRLFHFTGSAPANAAPSWQGYSAAKWGTVTELLPGQLPVGLGPRFQSRSRTLEVATIALRPGYLRKNGIPYSEKTALREYYDQFTEPNGETWVMVTTIVEDPTYLDNPFVTTTHFKKEADGSRWSPEPCTAK
jgi:hypothetical protein